MYEICGQRRTLLDIGQKLTDVEHALIATDATMLQSAHEFCNDSRRDVVAMVNAVL